MSTSFFNKGIAVVVVIYSYATYQEELSIKIICNCYLNFLKALSRSQTRGINLLTRAAVLSRIQKAVVQAIYSVPDFCYFGEKKLIILFGESTLSCDVLWFDPLIPEMATAL